MSVSLSLKREILCPIRSERQGSASLPWHERSPLAKRKVLDLKQTAQRIDPAAERLTLADLCDRYLATVRHLRPKTVSQKKYITERIKSEWPGGSDVLIRKVLPSHVQTFLCKYSFGASSYNAYLAVLRAMFNLAGFRCSYCRVASS